MSHVARKTMTVFGVRYPAGSAVPLDRFPPKFRRRLVEQRRVVPHVVEPTADTVPEVTQVAPLRCSGRTASDKQCKRNATGADGMCATHRHMANESTEG